MMKSRIPLITIAAVIALTFSVTALSGWWPFSNKEAAGEQEEIDKLMDGSDESNAEIARLEESFAYAPVVDDLDGKRVKIPAYVTPLEFNEDSSIKEFLLVPYMGACIHSPPPPANQVVHAQSPISIKFDKMYDPIWAVGTIRTETVKSDLAESGYRIEIEEVLPYEKTPNE